MTRLTQGSVLGCSRVQGFGDLTGVDIKLGSWNAAIYDNHVDCWRKAPPRCERSNRAHSNVEIHTHPGLHNNAPGCAYVTWN